MFPQELYSRFVNDPEFRRRFLADPNGVANALGHDLEPATVDAIRRMSPRSVSTVIESKRGSILAV